MADEINEEDEDPEKIWAAFEAGEKGITAPPGVAIDGPPLATAEYGTCFLCGPHIQITGDMAEHVKEYHSSLPAEGHLTRQQRRQVTFDHIINQLTRVRDDEALTMEDRVMIIDETCLDIYGVRAEILNVRA